MRYLLALSVLALAPLAVSAQGKEEKEEDLPPLPGIDLKRTDKVPYEEVHRILLKRCAACHTGKELQSRFDVSTYEKVIKGGKRGAAVVPGKGDSSLLYKSVMRTAK